MASRRLFATDEPESIYETPNHPQRRLRQPAPAGPGYDNYHNESDTNRQSGIGALGAGFMNGSMDDDDDDQVEEKYNPFTSEKEKEAFKHTTLDATDTRTTTPSPPPQYIAALRPGYVPQMETLSRPQPAVAPAARQPPAGLNINTSNNPFSTPIERSMYPNAPQPPQPVAVPSTPHPLQPPMTPITPVFARPKKQDIQFDEKPIMRGAGENTFIPSRGERGDDFWRRFSMVVKEENKKPSQQKQSNWLKTTQGRSNAMSRWVFLIGIVLTICAIGAIGLGVYLSHESTSVTQPNAIGGSADESGSTSLLPEVGDVTSSATLATSLHVSPTNTVARRFDEPEPTGPALDKRHKRHLHLNRSH
jgi:hypothetical protein